MFSVAVLLPELAYAEDSVLDALGRGTALLTSIEHVFVSPRSHDLVALIWITGRIAAVDPLQVAHTFVTEALPAWMTESERFHIALLGQI